MYTMQQYFNYVRTLVNTNTYNALLNHFTGLSNQYSDSLTLNDWTLYGSSRIGLQKAGKVIAAVNYTATYTNGAFSNITYTGTPYEAPVLTTQFVLIRGMKQYELSNHLGNVMAVISDKKLPVHNESNVFTNNFSSSLNGWTNGWTSNSAVSIDAGTQRMKVVTNVTYGGASYFVNTTPGKRYYFTYTLDIGNAPAIYVFARTAVNNTTYSGTNLSSTWHGAGATGFTISFVATTALTQLLFENTGSGGTVTFYVDDVAFKEEGTTQFMYHTADVLYQNDYSPFGAPIPGRSYAYNRMDAKPVELHPEQAGNMNLSGWQTTYCTNPNSCTTPETSVSLSVSNGKLTMQATKRYSQAYYTFNTVPGRVYRVKFRLSGSTFDLVNTSVLAPVNKTELFTLANRTPANVNGVDQELMFTATETSARFYITKGYSAAAVTATQQITLEYLVVQEVVDQVNYISCTNITQTLAMLSANGVNINDSVTARNYLNAYFNLNFSYAAYWAGINYCNSTTTPATAYVLPVPGAEAAGVERAYRYGFGGQEKDDEVSGMGNTMTAEYWEYDARLGRRWNVDPLTYEFPWQSPYATFDNNPIYYNDKEGLAAEREGEPKKSIFPPLNPTSNDNGWKGIPYAVPKDGDPDPTQGYFRFGIQLNEFVAKASTTPSGPQLSASNLPGNNPTPNNREAAEKQAILETKAVLRVIDNIITPVKMEQTNPETGEKQWVALPFGPGGLFRGASNVAQSAFGSIRVFNSLKSTLPSWKKVSVDMIHVASGHMVGGARIVLNSRKTIFPSVLNARQVEKKILEAYRNVHTKVVTQGSKIKLRGTANDGMEIEMWLNTETKIIDTAYPIK